MSSVFIPAFSGCEPPQSMERKVLAISCRLWRVSARSLSLTARHGSSPRATEALVTNISAQKMSIDGISMATLKPEKSRVSLRKTDEQRMRELTQQCDPSLQRANALAAEKGGLNWLT